MATVTLTLTDFLLARIAEDEAAARAAGSGRWASWNRSWDVTDHRDIADETATGGNPRLFAVPTQYDEHIARHDPARVLAECEAKRRIVAMALSVIASFGDWDAAEAKRLGGVKLWDDVTRRERGHAHELLEELAFPYADHPDFNPDWN